MIHLLSALPLLALAVQAPQVDSIRALAKDGSDSVLIERVRRRPVDARQALTELVSSGAGADSTAVQALAVAARLASAYAVAWKDSFFVRRVRRFHLLTPADRQATVAADSITRAGLTALAGARFDMAMRAYRESLRRFEALHDTAGVAAALQSIGAGLYTAQEYDSAEAYSARSRDLAARLGDYRTLGNALFRLGTVRERRGDLAGAAELFRRAKALREQMGDLRGVASIENSLAIVADRRGDRAAARRGIEAALATLRAGGFGDSALFLHNLGDLAMREGAYGEAAERFGEALSTARGLGDKSIETRVLVNLGWLAMRRADHAGAAKAFSEAAAIAQGTGRVVDEIEVRVNLAQALIETGNLQRARAAVERADSLATYSPGAGPRAWLAAVAIGRAQLALKFNQLGDAERQFARAESLSRGLGERDAVNRNRAQVGMAFLFYRREEYRQAQTVLERLLASGSLRDRGNEALVRVMIGRAALRRGDTAAARQTLTVALDSVRALGAVDDEAEALGLLGDLEARIGRTVAAESLYYRALNRLGTRGEPGHGLLLRGRVAAVLRRRGATAEAARELHAGITGIERVAGTLPSETFRSNYLADKWSAYVDLTQVEVLRGRTEAAFETSERLRARQMLELLSRGRVAGRQAVQDLSGREQDLRRRITELARDVDGRSVEEAQRLRDRTPADTAFGDVEQSLARAQDEYQGLLLKMSEADPSYAALVRAEVAPARAVMTALTLDEVLLEYLVGDSTTVVFVVTQDTLAAVDLRLSRDALVAQVDFARSALASPTGGAARRAWRAPLQRLYRQLFAPVEATGLLAGKRRVLVAPHAELHYLPFAALVGPGSPEQLLVERYVLEYLPSASVWLRLRKRPEPARSGGVLALAPRVAALPGSRAEVTAIRRTFGDRARTLVGPEASETAFRSMASGQELVHLATFGVLNKHNPLFSFVELAPGGDDDGRLEVHEVFGLSLDARLVVLSACQTGVGAGTVADVPPGDDWIGLVQAFLYAGAGNVLATLWPVSDVPTARLIDRFYAELTSGRSEAEALARAQRAALRHPTTAHPFFWAGFTLVRGR